MSGYFSVVQITETLNSLYAAYQSVLAGGKSYRLNDGQGDIQVTNASLGELERAIRFWESKLDEAGGGGFHRSSGIDSIQVGR